ncbi:Rv3235 family protein [Paeniglutamicibacter sp. MACA_103]|uniref:Rv3235 family protein n=1 Tax=Paeniglutamicibacter sp. MACA_103 TaxID=3377337 RepID=UPI003896162E
MSITAITPSTASSEPLLLHENVFATPGDVAAPRNEVRRFPEALRAGAAPRRRRCLRPVPLAEAPPRSFLSPAELEADFHAEFGREFEDDFPEASPNPAARMVLEQLFPPTNALLSLEESVAAIVHAAAPAVLEVLAGARPARQLHHALSPTCMNKLEQHMRLGAMHRPDPGACCYSNPRVMRMRITQVLPLVFEAAVILRDMQKVRATALRIERWHGRWQVTALEIG